jgi:NADH-quinone oxidoreductase subunit J
VSAEEMLFYAFAGAAVVSAVAVGLLASRPAASCLCLAACMLSLAGVYALLEAHFVAGVQALVHAGLVPLALFSLTLLGGRRGRGRHEVQPRQVNRAVLIVTGAVLLVGLAGSQLPAFQQVLPAPPGFGGSLALGLALYGEYFVPLLATSLLLLAAVVGAAAFTKGGAAE